MCAERIYGFVIWLVVESVIQWVSSYSAVMVSVSCQLSLNLARSHWTYTSATTGANQGTVQCRM